MLVCFFLGAVLQEFRHQPSSEIILKPALIDHVWWFIMNVCLQYWPILNMVILSWVLRACSSRVRYFTDNLSTSDYAIWITNPRITNRVMVMSTKHAFALISFVKGEFGGQTPNLFRGRLLKKKNVQTVKTVYIVTGVRALSKNDQSLNHIGCV